MAWKMCSCAAGSSRAEKTSCFSIMYNPQEQHRVVRTKCLNATIYNKTGNCYGQNATCHQWTYDRLCNKSNVDTRKARAKYLMRRPEQVKVRTHIRLYNAMVYDLLCSTVGVNDSLAV